MGKTKLSLICVVCKSKFEYTHRERSDGRGPRKTCSPECRKNLFAQNTKTSEAMVKFSESSFGNPKKAELTKMGSKHHSCKKGVLISPDGTEHPYTNLSEFVRQHEDLFDPDSVKWKSEARSRVTGKMSPATGTMVCRANKLLSMVCSNKNRLKGWKGWTGYYT